VGRVRSAPGPSACQACDVASHHFPPATDDQQAGFAPCFPVTDMQAALAHYDQLGFTVMPYELGAEWGWVRFGNAEIHLYIKEDHDPTRTAAAADLHVIDCDALEHQWSAMGVPGTSDAYDTEYGMREAVHVDLDHNLIRFGSRLKKE
jgi:hypothetical protein